MDTLTHQDHGRVLGHVRPTDIQNTTKIVKERVVVLQRSVMSLLDTPPMKDTEIKGDCQRISDITEQLAGFHLNEFLRFTCLF